MSERNGQKSNDSQEVSKTPTATIKIAPKEPTQREGADIGPGDPGAAPSEAPQSVDIPEAPSPSDLVVKSASKESATRPRSSNPGASTASRPNNTVSVAGNVASGSRHSTNQDLAGKSVHSRSGAPSSVTPNASGSKYASTTSTLGRGGGGGPQSTSKALSNAEPVEGSSPAPSSGPRSVSPNTSPASSRSASPMSGTGNVTSSTKAPTDSDVAIKSAPSVSPKSASPKTATSRPAGTSSAQMAAQGTSTAKPGDGKVTRFKYHKRITVKTKGKTSPSAVMNKVNKDRVRLTPSTIGEMDSQELMRRTGIKNTKKTHWRVRLRQTKRITQGGKTSTQVRVAYRDSEGNKKVMCETCGKKLEECKCDSS